VSRARILLADDHRMFAEGLKVLLSAEFDLVGVVDSGRAMMEAARTLRPDVIVADITMPDLNGIDALVQLKQEDPGARVILLTMHRNPAYARRALEAGAAGYVLKHGAVADLVFAVREALAGRTFVTSPLAADLRCGSAGAVRTDGGSVLTARQREILQLLAEGLTAKEVARRLDISARTVEFHKYRLMETLGARNSAELIHCAIRLGLAGP